MKLYGFEVLDYSFPLLNLGVMWVLGPISEVLDIDWGSN